MNGSNTQHLRHTESRILVVQRTTLSLEGLCVSVCVHYHFTISMTKDNGVKDSFVKRATIILRILLELEVSIIKVGDEKWLIRTGDFTIYFLPTVSHRVA